MPARDILKTSFTTSALDSTLSKVISIEDEGEGVRRVCRKSTGEAMREMQNAQVGDMQTRIAAMKNMQLLTLAR